jgi:hypothetical protein
MHYLAKEHWSPRYDSTFFTMQVTGKELLSSPPPAPDAIDGKDSHPSVYFQVHVFSEQKEHACLRRYSQFKWLHQTLISSPPPEASHEEHSLSLPPGTCPWQSQDAEFLQVRLEELRDYLRDVLARPGYAKHPAIRLFLELDKFDSTNGGSAD